jgi:hypothetical protein
MKLRKGKFMNYVTGNYNVTGTCLQGTINTSYDRLVDLFGEPTQLEADGKVQVEWAVKFTDGTLATIYDWKEEKTVSAVTEWHVGGHTQHALYNVIDEVI